MENSVPYHCPKCRSGGEQVVFVSLPELRQHILKVHFNQHPPQPTSTSFPLHTSLNQSSIPSLTFPLPKDIRSVQGTTEPEQLAQAKKYLMMEAMKSTDQNREQIRRLNEEIKIKESSLDSAIKKLSTLSEKNQNIEVEYGRVEMQNKQIRSELEDLKAKLMEKERLLEDKNKKLADQLNYMKSIEEKEAMAKEKLEKTVEKIIERAETAERNLEMLKLSTANPDLTTQNRSRDLAREVDSTQKNDELRVILESCNSASSTTHKQASSNNPEFLSKMVTPTDARQNTNHLVQVYLKNFLDKYNELKAKDYAFNQTMPLHSSVPQIQIIPQDLDHSQNGVSARQRLRPERDLNIDEDDIGSSKDRPSNVNNNNNYYRDQYLLNSKSTLSTMTNLQNDKKSPVWTNYDDDDDDEALTEISDDLEEEHIQSTPLSRAMSSR